MAALSTPRRRRLTNSPFDTLERTFALLVSGPDPLALDCSGIAGLPGRAIPLDELKARLLHPSTRFEIRDAIVSVLVTRARPRAESWTVGLAGVLLPGLRGTLRTLVQACPGKADDIEAEALAALLAAVAAAIRAGPGWRRGCAGKPAKVPPGCCTPRWPSGQGRATNRSRPPRPDRGATRTSCSPKRSEPGSSRSPTPS